ncbi:unnamed protein product [Symbiodinium sp. CCMP2592]|nr:unnamed protein product [Symbiodinium sp. CCMP2592]
MADEEETKKYDVPLIRLKDCSSQLDTDDLDEEERKALAEVSKKGYYHARPKTQEAPSPQRIENPEELPQARPTTSIRKRTTFDTFQKKWDKFDKEEPELKVVEPQKPVEEPPARSSFSCCRRKRTAEGQEGNGKEKYGQDYLRRGVQRMTNHQSSDVTLRSERDELIDLITAAGGGSLMRGWRQALDPQGELEVDYDDFCRVTGQWRWVGDINALFGGDGDLDHLSLMEIANKEGKLMNNFMRWIRDEFGSPADFFLALDANKKGKVARHTFVSFCVNRDFKASEADLNRVFDCIDTGDIGSIVKEDCIFLELDPMKRNEERQRGGLVREWKQRAAMEFLQNARTGLKPLPGEESVALPERHRLAPRPWQAGAFEQIPMVVCQRRYERERDTRFKRKCARATFLKQICISYGNEVRALRRDIKPGGHHMTLTDIRKYCRQVDLPVEISHLWQSLDTDSDGKVRMEELCSPRAEVLAKFKEWSRQKFGTAMALWETPEAVRARARWRGQGLWISDTKMLIPAFGEALRELEWPGIHCQEERSYVFSSLDSMGCNLITPEDLAWLDRWIPSEFLAADPSPTAWADLKEILVKTYQHPLRAWRILDRDNSNRIAWTEFRDVCKKVHFTGDIVGAWRMLDTDMSGYISMREYDPSSEELLTSFKEWADSNFGSVRHCFKALDSDRSGSVTYAELKCVIGISRFGRAGLLQCPHPLAALSLEKQTRPSPNRSTVNTFLVKWVGTPYTENPTEISLSAWQMKWMGNVRTLFDCLDLDSADRPLTYVSD